MKFAQKLKRMAGRIGARVEHINNKKNPASALSMAERKANNREKAKGPFHKFAEKVK